jgi:prevent-host-death family protein
MSYHELYKGESMESKVLKAQFKPRALEYFREVKRTGMTLVITDRGRPVLEIAPYKDDQPNETLKLLRNSVIKYDRPTEPVGMEEWEALT